VSQSNREQLQQIAALIKSGSKAQAVKQLVPILKAEPQNAAAWWLMANAVSDEEQKKRALKRFLQLRPGDEKATQMLAKLEPSTEDDDPFSDPDNPFVAAAQADVRIPKPTSRQRPVVTLGNADDPFNDVESDDDPFADVSAARASKRELSAKPKRSADAPASSSNSSMLILGGVIAIAVIAVGAAALIATNRANSGASALNSSGQSAVVVDAVVHCDDDESPFNENDDLGARLPARVDMRGELRLGDAAEGSFRGNNELHGYRFNGEGGQWLVIEMWSPDGNIDPKVEVYDPNGEQFALCDDNLESLDTYMEVRLPRSGQYTIVAQTFGLGEGDYVISVEAR
jgi:hypothetical protein